MLNNIKINYFSNLFALILLTACTPQIIPSTNTSSFLTDFSSSNIENDLSKNKKELEKFISNISTPLSLEHEKVIHFQKW